MSKWLLAICTPGIGIRWMSEELVWKKRFANIGKTYKNLDNLPVLLGYRDLSNLKAIYKVKADQGTNFCCCCCCCLNMFITIDTIHIWLALFLLPPPTAMFIRLLLCIWAANEHAKNYEREKAVNSNEKSVYNYILESVHLVEEHVYPYQKDNYIGVLMLNIRGFWIAYKTILWCTSNQHIVFNSPPNNPKK